MMDTSYTSVDSDMDDSSDDGGYIPTHNTSRGPSPVRGPPAVDRRRTPVRRFLPGMDVSFGRTGSSETVERDMDADMDEDMALDRDDFSDVLHRRPAASPRFPSFPAVHADPFRSSLSPMGSGGAEPPSHGLEAAAAAMGRRSPAGSVGLFASPPVGSPMAYAPASPTPLQLTAMSTPTAVDRSGGSSSSKPLPDMSAFDTSANSSLHRHTPQRGPPPPPTPLRPSPGLSRVDSLQANRTLVDTDSDSEGGSPAGHPHHHHAPVVFERDFDNLGEIGHGSFSVVYKARYKSDGIEYAVKRTVKPLHSRRDREFHLNEIRVTQAIGANPNIIHYHRAWQEHAHLYQQAELCPRGSLDGLLSMMPEGVPVPTDAVYCVIADVANGLRAAHAAGFVHLDIKPENIFIAQSGHLKIGDFGLARPYGNASDADGVEGDNRYMAPELLRTGGVGPANDIFSLGVSALELAWDMAPPQAGVEWHNLRQHRLPPVPVRCRDRPRALLELIAQMMHPDPKMRPTAEQLFAVPEVKAAHGSASRLLKEAPEEATDPTARRAKLEPPAPDGRTFGRSGSYAAAELITDFPDSALARSGSASGGASGGAPTLRRSGTLLPGGQRPDAGTAAARPEEAAAAAHGCPGGVALFRNRSNSVGLRRSGSVCKPAGAGGPGAGSGSGSGSAGGPAAAPRQPPPLHIRKPSLTNGSLFGRSDSVGSMGLLDSPVVATPTDQPIVPRWYR